MSSQNNYLPTLEERLNPSISRAQGIIDKIFQNLRVALPGIVKSFDSAAGTVSVQITTNEYVEQNQGENGIVNLQTQASPLPILNDVPIQVYGAGGWSITIPIQAGDECIVVFMDAPIDIWFQNGGTGNNPISQRRHDLSDAIAFFGTRSTPRLLSNYSTDSMQLRNDNATVVIDIASGKVTVTAPSAEVNCSGDVTVTGETVEITGNSSVTIKNNTTIDGIAFDTHYHEVFTAPGNTGPPL